MDTLHLRKRLWDKLNKLPLTILNAGLLTEGDAAYRVG